MYHYYFLLEFDFIQEPTFCIVENLGCFLRITEEVFVWMILDAGFEMNEMIKTLNLRIKQSEFVT